MDFKKEIDDFFYRLSEKQKTEQGIRLEELINNELQNWKFTKLIQEDNDFREYYDEKESEFIDNTFLNNIDSERI